MDRKSLLAASAAAFLLMSSAAWGVAAPSDLAVTGFATTPTPSVSLRWEDNSGGSADGFRIYRSPDGSAWSLIDTWSFTTYGDSTVAVDSTYFYYVTAYVGIDESAPSNTVQVKVEPYYVTVTKPNGGETLNIGSIYDVTWDTNMPDFDAVISLSVDGGTDWTEVQFAWAPDSSPYPWKVGYKDISYDLATPPEWVQVVTSTETQCVIRIMEYNDCTAPDESDAVFTIEPPWWACGSGSELVVVVLLLAAARRRRRGL